MIRILHICEAFDPGGVVWWLLDVLKFMPRDEFQCDFYSLGKTPGMRAQEVIEQGCEITLFQATPKEVFWGAQLRSLLRQKRYDVVHAHIFNLSGWLLRHAYDEEVPIRIAHYHNTSDGRSDTLLAQVRRRISRQVVSRYANAKLGCSQVALKNSPRLHNELLCQVLYYGIDTQRFTGSTRKIDLRAELDLPPNVKIVAHIGRFYPQKNHSGLVEIFARVADCEPKAHLVLIGDGPLMPQIRKRVIELGIANRVWFLGVRSDIAELLHETNVVTFPSLWEGLGIASIEARMAGIPLVASDLPSIAEAMDGCNGYSLVRHDDQQRFAEEILKFLAVNTRITPPFEWVAKFERQNSAKNLFEIYRKLKRTVS